MLKSVRSSGFNLTSAQCSLKAELHTSHHWFTYICRFQETADLPDCRGCNQVRVKVLHDRGAFWSAAACCRLGLAHSVARKALRVKASRKSGTHSKGFARMRDGILRR